MKQSNYELERDYLKSGDLIAFGGKGAVSRLIKLKTSSKVSHVGIVLETNTDYCDRNIVQLIESTSLGDGFAGVQINKMSTRVKQYEGEIWILPMNDKTRLNLNLKDYITWLTSQTGKAYDTPGAIGAGLDGLFPDTQEDFSKLFCSELVSGGLQAGNAIDESVNASEETPIDNCRYKIWKSTIQIKGREKELS